ncbi:MAG TPA: MBL fold metallo-hydrolase [Solirubrobacterales bacterium]|nr:MBL fold metallo-hydrolase [Solirubrobacterales bacterium]
MHLGRDRVIGAYEMEGLIVDPGPSSCLEALLAGLDGEPRALLLTHIHLDHAGASGSLVRRFPKLRVYVHEAGAPHLVDPAKLLSSARRLYGDEMERLWGAVAAVPASNVVALGGGERVEGFRVAYTPGHASHHVAYLHEATGEAYVGDVAGVRIPPLQYTVAPTPPPDIDLEAWERSLQTVADWGPQRLCLTHFGRVDDVERQLERVREGLRTNAERARQGDRERFLAELEAEIESEADEEVAERQRQAAPAEQLWLGLERYWRKRS